MFSKAIEWVMFIESATKDDWRTSCWSFFGVVWLIA